MIKIMSFIRRNPKLSPEEFRDYWTNVHAPLVLERLPGLIHYKGNFPVPRTRVPVEIDATDCDLIVEMAFADRETMDAQMTSPCFLAEDREASSNHFMDMAASSALVVEEIDAL
jgi:hypothetical protein